MYKVFVPFAILHSSDDYPFKTVEEVIKDGKIIETTLDDRMVPTHAQLHEIVEYIGMGIKVIFADKRVIPEIFELLLEIYNEQYDSGSISNQELRHIFITLTYLVTNFENRLKMFYFEKANVFVTKLGGKAATFRDVELPKIRRMKMREVEKSLFNI